MSSRANIKKDLETLKIKEDQDISIDYVTAKYKRLAKEIHPDRPGGVTSEFQELLNAYRRIIKYLEEHPNEQEEEEENMEAAFFMKHNFMKECTGSYVVYIEEKLVDCWQKVLERHIEVHKMDKIRKIFKTGDITITMYAKPKKDPRSKFHIQSRDQNKNLQFILENLSMFYSEVLEIYGSPNSELGFRQTQRSLCSKCGKSFTNKKGVKQHILRMHSSTSKKIRQTKINQTGKQVTIPTVTTNAILPQIIAPVQDYGEDIIQGILEEIIDKCGLKANQDASKEVEVHFQCDICGKTFELVQESQDHTKNEHNISDNGVC